MGLSKLWVSVIALGAAVIAGVAGYLLLNPPRPLLADVGFTETRITPNADQDTDITEFHYTLSETARITLAFESADGQRYAFRENVRRVPGDYTVLFSGVVDGFQLPDETPLEGVLETRLLPDGLYTWTLRATADGDEHVESGTLEIAEGDPELPLITAFDVGPTLFTPNQDGIRDRINVNVFLSKPSALQVFLQDAKGVQIFLPRREREREPGEEGNHEYDYDGGVDLGFRPPEDGTYTLYAVSQDDEGQRYVLTREITVEDSGLPQVEIIPQSTGGTVCFEGHPYEESYMTTAESEGEKIEQPTAICSALTTLTLPVGDILVFHLTIRNYGETPVRTAGPFPGTVYSDTQLASTLDAYEESGAYRLGIECGTSLTSYPWRWALAPLDELTAVYDAENDQTYFYLQPGQRSEVWGAVRLTEIIPARNPQPCWAGLIHEDVGIQPQQNNVGRREIELVPRAE
jgi:hypothetical protein